MDHIRVTATVTRADHLAAARAVESSEATWAPAIAAAKRNRRRTALATAPVLIALITLTAGLFPGRMFVEHALAGVVLAAFTVLGVLSLDVRTPILRRHREAVEAADFTIASGVIEFSADARVVRVKSAAIEIITSWRFAFVNDVPDYFLIQCRDRSTFLIPKSAFESPEHAKKCHDTMLGWWKTAQAHDQQLVREFLAHRDVPCPKCRYNLRDSTTAKCPECAYPLSSAELLPAPQ